LGGFLVQEADLRKGGIIGGGEEGNLTKWYHREGILRDREWVEEATKPHYLRQHVDGGGGIGDQV